LRIINKKLPSARRVVLGCNTLSVYAKLKDIVIIVDLIIAVNRGPNKLLTSIKQVFFNVQIPNLFLALFGFSGRRFGPVVREFPPAFMAGDFYFRGGGFFGQMGFQEFNDCGRDFGGFFSGRFEIDLF